MLFSSSYCKASIRRKDSVGVYGKDEASAYLGQEVVSFFCEGPGSKHFRLCRPHGL